MYVCRYVLLSTKTIPSSTIIHNDMYTFFWYRTSTVNFDKERQIEREIEIEMER